MTRLIQIKRGGVRRVALVEEPHLRMLSDCPSIYWLAKAATAAGVSLTEAARQRASADVLEYDPIYGGTSDWCLQPPIDHPDDAARCLISGNWPHPFGRLSRSLEDACGVHEEVTDSMKMFRWGMEGGRPTSGQIGTPPEWFLQRQRHNAARPHGGARYPIVCGGRPRG